LPSYVSTDEWCEGIAAWNESRNLAAGRERNLARDATVRRAVPLPAVFDGDFGSALPKRC
jgi:hypothetical protein